MQPPAQELVARDLHDNTWTFRHIYRGMASFLIHRLLYPPSLSNI
jgi:hypothetical protein